MESWKIIPEFPNYAVSDLGQIENIDTGRLMALNMNQFNVLFVGFWHKGQQFKRSVPKLVAKAFIPQPSDIYDTPINLNGDRHDNRVDNLMWRPRWFAIMYNQQFNLDDDYHIPDPLEDMSSGEVSENSFEVAKRYGLLEKDVVMAIQNRTYVWPTYQQFRIL